MSSAQMLDCGCDALHRAGRQTRLHCPSHRQRSTQAWKRKESKSIPALQKPLSPRERGWGKDTPH
ncbi:hypothetical protein LMG919_07960 [Xanthomonas vesicatoria]|nr:hypothetical protein LMG919_07960 [Xanthomonas vesicatoria]